MRATKETNNSWVELYAICMIYEPSSEVEYMPYIMVLRYDFFIA